jgi:ATP-independent RNA helicase DbpA
MGAVGKIEQYQKLESTWHKLDELTPTGKGPLQAPMVTLQLLGGRKEKIRPGDVLGALTADAGYSREQIGKIVVTEFTTFVAVQRDIALPAMQKLNAGKVKGKSVKVRLL